MKLSKLFKILIDLKFSIFLLVLIAIFSSIGSFIEQEQIDSFYEKNYPITDSFYWFLNYKVISFFGFSDIYHSIYFFLLLFLLAFSLIGCSLKRQFPLFTISKKYFFKRNKVFFYQLPFSDKLSVSYFFIEKFLSKFQKDSYFIYQKKFFLYGYKGLIGRLSPILVHLSLVLIIFGSTLGSFNNYKAQEIIPKGEIFHVQNSVFSSLNSFFPQIPFRVNDFWVEYDKGIKQFYSNFSVLNSFGEEVKEKTLAVNTPFKYNFVDFYQSDWTLNAIRVKTSLEKLSNNYNRLFQYPIYPIQSTTKFWITCFDFDKFLIINTFDDKYSLYDNNFNLINYIKNYNLTNISFLFLEIIPSTGLLVKSDISIFFIYIGFGSLIITTFLSYLPYTQLWLIRYKKYFWIGNLTNRGKLKLEIDFQNFQRNYKNYVISIQKSFNLI